MMVSKRQVGAALRPAVVAALVACALAPQGAQAAPLPGFTFSPSSPFTNDLVEFTSTSSGGTVPEQWDLDGDRVCDDASGPAAARSFWPSGVYAVTLCISDGVDSATVTRRVTVRNRPPVAGIVYAPNVPLSGDEITLTSTAADPDGPLTSITWDLDGDGQFDDWRGPAASVSFTTPGRHTVGLLVVDRDQAGAAAVVDIPVQARPPEAISPFPVVRVVGTFGRPGIRIDQLVITAPDGARVEIKCRGRGCPFRRMIRKPRPQTVRVRRFAHRVLRPGAVVQVWVTKPGEIGKYTRLRIRSGRRPVRVDRCLMPGSKRPVRCLS